MTLALNAATWVSKFDGKVLAELPETVATQLAAYDKTNTGIGFVFVLQSVGSNGEGDKVIYEHELVSYTALKIKGIWYIICDTNLSDVASGVFRMVLTNIAETID